MTLNKACSSRTASRLSRCRELMAAARRFSHNRSVCEALSSLANSSWRMPYQAVIHCTSFNKTLAPGMRIETGCALPVPVHF